MRALALDPATTTGWACGDFGSKPRSGVIRLPVSSDPKDVGPRFNWLEGAVRNLIGGNAVECLIIEDIYLSTQKFSQPKDVLLKGYRAAIVMAADKQGLNFRNIIWAFPGEWRKSFGTSTVPREVRESKDQSARRKYLKMATYERCRELGWEPKSTDESDAMGLWFYGETLLSQFVSNQRMPLFATVKL